MKNIVSGMLVVAMIVVLQPQVANAATVENELRDIAKAMQKGLPMRVNDELQATSLTATGKTLLGIYRFTKKSSSISNVENMKNEFYKNAVNHQCTHPDMKILISRGAYLKQEYYDIDNRYIFGYAIDQNICKRIQ